MYAPSQVPGVYFICSIILLPTDINMKVMAMGVLLCLLSALVEVHSQTVPYVRFMSANLANHSYVNLTLVGNATNGSTSVQCHTDRQTCCSRTQGGDRGDWHAPGSQDILPFPNQDSDIYQSRTHMRVDLRRRNNGGMSGVYRCTIETNTVKNEDGRETVYVGLYVIGGENGIMFFH